MSEKKNEEQEDCRCYAASRHRAACPQIRNVTHPLRYYELTEDEVKALQECDRESFYRRCLPCSAALASATYAAVKYRYLARHPHFGVVPKVLLAMMVGHVVGRLSYMSSCDAHLRDDLPETSRLGNLLRNYHATNNTQNKSKIN